MFFSHFAYLLGESSGQRLEEEEGFEHIASKVACRVPRGNQEVYSSYLQIILSYCQQSLKKLGYGDHFCYAVDCQLWFKFFYFSAGSS